MNILIKSFSFHHGVELHKFTKAAAQTVSCPEDPPVWSSNTDPAGIHKVWTFTKCPALQIFIFALTFMDKY